MTTAKARKVTTKSKHSIPKPAAKRARRKTVTENDIDMENIVHNLQGMDSVASGGSVAPSAGPSFDARLREVNTQDGAELEKEIETMKGQSQISLARHSFTIDVLTCSHPGTRTTAKCRIAKKN